MKPHPGVNAACNPATWPREDALPVSRASCSPADGASRVAGGTQGGRAFSLRSRDDLDALVARFPYVGPRLRGDDPDALVARFPRSEERRVGKGGVSTYRSRRSPIV